MTKRSKTQPRGFKDGTAGVRQSGREQGGAPTSHSTESAEDHESVRGSHEGGAFNVVSVDSPDDMDQYLDEGLPDTVSSVATESPDDSGFEGDGIKGRIRRRPRKSGKR
ncbi:MAG TPA: hypothetical protein GX507_04360 [Clostridia bacterium]|nr:hypothetical protein [Clostridia bacterium]